MDALCHDDDFCTGDDTGDVCDPSDSDAGSDGCVRDGDPCGGTMPVCDGPNEECVGCNTDNDCDDGATCTSDDCEGDGSCTNTPVNVLCDDDLFCTDDDFCDPDDENADETTGCVNETDPCECAHPSDPCGGAPGDRKICSEINNGECQDCNANQDCDDGITCTLDSCAGLAGVCTNQTDDDSCPDPDFCDGDDVCDPTNDDADANGCLQPGYPCGGTTPVCDEADDGSCNACTSNLDCDDGIDCTNDSCNGLTGACTNGPDDGNCTGADQCSDTLGCVECLVDGDCDDGLFCTGVETCGADGSCDASPGDPCSGTTPICDDVGDACNACANDGECAAIGATTCELDGSCS